MKIEIASVKALTSMKLRSPRPRKTAGYAMAPSRLRTLLPLAVLFAGFTAVPLWAAEFFVHPEGRATADGSRSDPWDLATALAQPAAVQPGDLIWLLGGTYSHPQPLVSLLTGTDGSPIILRAFPGERATIDCARSAASQPGGDCLLVKGSHTWYWGFEVMNSSPIRWATASGSAADPRGLGIHSQAGLGTKFINLIIHDVGTSLFESQPSGIEIYGAIAFNSGWEGPDRSHGPGFYIRNRSSFPAKTLKENIVFQHFRQGLQGFGSFVNVFSNFLLEGNVFFNNGIGAGGFHRNLMFGNDNTEHTQNTFRQNYTYFSPGSGAGANMLASTAGGCRGLVVTQNVFAHGPQRTALEINHCQDIVVSGNLLFGKASFLPMAEAGEVQGAAFRAEFPANQYYGDDLAPPSGLSAFLRPNQYEPRRAHLIVYNWDRRETVFIDLSSLAIPFGDRYELRAVQDYFGEPLEGVYHGRALALPMTGWQPAKPIGYEQHPLPPTFPEFGVFVLTWSGPGSAPRDRPGAARSRQSQRFARKR